MWWLFACLSPESEPEPASFASARDEAWRPQFHFSPAENWLNDPAGLVYFRGLYHLFYQHQADTPVWGEMSWGHATSPDLVTWTDQPIALSPDPVLGQVYTGSALVGDLEDCVDCLILAFTHSGGDDGTQKQSLASSDNGVDFTLFDRNPVLANPGVLHFRDPKVIRYEDHFVMAVAAGHRVSFYASEDLIHWEHRSDFGPEGLDGGIWECPELLALELDGETHWVLQVDLNPGGPQGGSGSAWFLGDFDGTAFTGSLQGWVDHGRDFYAAQAWSDIDTPTWIAWMSSWQYGLVTPTAPWRGALTIPRHVSLIRRNGAIALSQIPIDLSSLYRGRVAEGERLEITMQADLSAATELSLGVRLGADEGTWLRWVPGTLTVDRTQSGTTAFSPVFPEAHTAEVALDNGILDLHLLVDRSSVEVFAAEGTVVFTEQIFPSASSRGVSLQTDGDVLSYEIRELDTIWPLP